MIMDENTYYPLTQDQIDEQDAAWAFYIERRKAMAE
jgi:hypothetical protein